MPISTKRLEPGIYYADWYGYVTRQEIMQSPLDVKVLAMEDNRARYVIIIDTGRFRNGDFDVRALMNAARIIEQSTIARVVVQAPTLAKVAGNILNKLIGSHFEFVPTLEAAMNRARVLLTGDAARRTQPEATNEAR
jgi:hypothetical protein